MILQQNVNKYETTFFHLLQILSFCNKILYLFMATLTGGHFQLSSKNLMTSRALL